jgi:(p)ppGpp synthase/HD superfamily hydrolase
MDYSEPCQYSTRLIEKLQSLDTENILDFKLIDKAIYWAKKYHDGQFRKSGEPYYTHPLEVAYLVSEYKLTTNVIVTAILHDVVEDSEATVGMIVDAFSWRIAEMVDRLTRDRPDGSKLSVEEIIYNSNKNEDDEVILIKVVDRLHNMQTIQYQDRSKQQQNAVETIKNIIGYVPNLKLEQSLNMICTKLINPNRVEYLNKLYSKKLSFFDNQASFSSSLLKRFKP